HLITAELGFASIDAGAHWLSQPAGDTERDPKLGWLHQLNSKARFIRFWKTRGLPQRNGLVRANPFDGRAREKINIQLVGVMEVNKIQVIGNSLWPCAGATGPPKVGVALGPAKKAVIRIVEDTPVRGHGKAGAQAVDCQPLDPVAIPRVASKRNQV